MKTNMKSEQGAQNEMDLGPSLHEDHSKKQHQKLRQKNEVDGLGVGDEFHRLHVVTPYFSEGVEAGPGTENSAARMI